MSGEAHLVGIGATPFGRHSDTPLVELGKQAAKAALADAGVHFADIGEVFASSTMAPPQTGIALAHRLGRTGAPVTTVESASAGGLVALRHAIEAVRSGRCERALAVGVEKLTALEPGGVVPRPTSFWDRCPPQVHYAVEATRWLHDHGAGEDVLAAVAAKDWNLAAANPLAARRTDHEVTIEEVLASRPVATPLTRMMCHTASDGAAAVVVGATGRVGSVEVRSISQTSMIDDPTWPTSGPVIGSPAQAALTAHQAFESAGMDPSEVQVVSLHDMCASEELTTLVSLGLVADDQIVDLVNSGGLLPGGAMPTNVDGGCIARGHPIGATGLAQTGEIVRQLRGDAGSRQVPGARRGLVHGAGGGGSCVVALLGR